MRRVSTKHSLSYTIFKCLNNAHFKIGVVDMGYLLDGDYYKDIVKS